MKKKLAIMATVTACVLGSMQLVHAEDYGYFNVQVMESDASSKSFSSDYSDSLENPNKATWKIYTLKDGLDVDKAEVIAAMEKLGENNQISPFAVYPTRYLSDSYKQKYSDGELAVDFSDSHHFETPFLGSPTGTSFYRGSSSATWSGRTPYNMDLVTLTDSITFKGIGVSISANPSGASISGSSTSRTVTMNSSINNTYLVRHTYSNVQGTGMVSTLQKRSEASFKCNGTTRFINAYDSGVSS